MKKFFRKIEHFTIHTSTEPIELDTEWFPEYNGNSEQQFFSYIVKNYNRLHNDMGLCEEARRAISILVEGEKKEFYNSNTKYPKYYSEKIQMGLINKESKDTGCFKTQMSSN